MTVPERPSVSSASSPLPLSTSPALDDTLSDAPPSALPRLPWWVRVLDALTLIGVALLISNVVFGGFAARFGDVKLSATSPWRSLIAIAIPGGLRWTLYRSTPVWTRVAGAWRRAWATDERRAILGPYLSTRLMVLLVGYIAVVSIGYPEGAPPFRVARHEGINLPARWDAGWYLGIAIDGYYYSPRAQGQQNVVFFPAYPMLTRATAGFLGAQGPDDPRETRALSEIAFRRQRRTLLAGMVVSLLAFAAALVYLYRLAREMLGDDREAAAGAVLLICAYPFSVFFSAFYTESLFLLGALGTFYHFRRQEWGRAIAFGLLVGLTRPNGCMLSIPLAWLAWQQARVRGAAPWPPVPWPPVTWKVQMKPLAIGILAAAMPGIGMLLYTAGLHLMTGHGFAWVDVQRAWGRTDNHQVVSFMMDRLSLIARDGLYSYSKSDYIELFNALATFGAVGLLWPVARRLGVAYALLVIVILGPPFVTGGFLALGRMSSTLFPLFIYLGWTIRGERLTSVLLAAAGLQALFSVLFHTWRPMF